MSARASTCLLWAALLLTLLCPRQAGAWVETVVRSHEARVEVRPDGGAVVRHDLVLKVRGGPMKSLEVSGIGTIGDPLPDALVRSAEQGSSGAWPLVISSLEDGSLRLKIGAERGLRGGTYQFTFAYQSDLKELGRIEAVDDGVELSFIGPRLATGVDSAKVTFVVPRAPEPPRLGRADETGAGVLLSEIRRGSEWDEVELVRAHLAIGEPAIWRVIVDREAISPAVLAPVPEHAELLRAPRSVSSPSGLLEGNATRRYLPLALLVGVLFGVLAFLKARFTLQAASLSDVRVKPLLPGTPPLRGGVVALAVAGGGLLALLQQPWMAVAALSLACAATTHLLPVRIVRPRGPGVWEAVELGRTQAAMALPGGMFEIRRLSGLLVFALLTLVILGSAYRILPQSNYFALMVLALELVVVPLFFTGQLRDFPQVPLEQARPWLKFLRRGVDAQVATLELWGRRSGVGEDRAQSAPSPKDFDEARIRLILREAPLGLRALEVSLDEAAGAHVMPCVIIRALEDSPAVRALPGDVPWQRGRAAEERVAVLRPSAPTPAQLLRLLRTLLTNLRASARHSSRRAERSSGRGASTSKESLPAAQAM
jgi:hypothetical protein